jgi:uncharacterized protein YyaL (SSP411 family)
MRLRQLASLLLLCLTALLPVHAFSAQEGKHVYTNRLIDSHDPYLLLHAHNPVDWYPWGAEALEKARRENKPIFISIGYSTCYWCHVAEREIYSNPQIAKLMNEWFVNIKIDREERPDLDRIYMLATRIMTGNGGWPNNVFLTPDLKPFYAGSYFPPNDTDGRPGFPQILTRLHQSWVDDHGRVLEIAESVYRTLQQNEQEPASTTNALVDTGKWLAQAVQESAANFDDFEGGFGGGTTKFPRSPQLTMLLAAHTQNPQAKTLEMIITTLEAMAEGGVMDQLGGGFHRYSTEPSWSIPHFEKMLYDNAQLLDVYAQAYAITKKPLFRQVALSTADYLTREMQAPGGGFYSAQDAEAGGVEGASYVWTMEQIESVLGAVAGKRFFTLYALTKIPAAPFGHEQLAGGVLRLKESEARRLAQNNRLAAKIAALSPSRDKLLAVRQSRVQPLRDDKIVTSDNALAIIAFAHAGKALYKTTLTRTAARTADWLWQHAFDPQSGDLKHQFFRGHAGDRGFLDDYALLGKAFFTLYRITNDTRWQSRARQLADAMLQRFVQPDGALATSWDTTNLLVAPPTEGDSVKPSGQSAAITLLLELAATTDEARYAVAARKALTQLSQQVSDYPSGWGALMASLSDTELHTALVDATNDNELANAKSQFDSAAQVNAEGRRVISKQGVDLVITINVGDSYHINANPASEPFLVATQLMIDGHPKVKVEYPESHTFKAPFAPQGIAVYQGRITLRAHLPQVFEMQPPAVSLRIQACNDKVCLAPATIVVPIGSTKTDQD